MTQGEGQTENNGKAKIVLANHKNPSLASGGTGDKPQMIPSSVYSEIQSYKNIKVFDCEENFGTQREAVKYQTVIIDATNGGIE